MQTVYVKPKDGGRVRQPERASRVMPAEGDLVPRNGYYTRLLIGGDVVACDAPQAPRIAEPTPAPELPSPKASTPVVETDTKR